MRRFLRVLAWVFLGVPLLLLLTLGLFYGGYALWARGGVDTDHVTYLRTHQETAASPAALRFGLFDSAFYRNRLFLLGEAHGCAVPQAIDLALLRHLNARAGVRHYVAEIDPAQAYYFNQYLTTGDEAPLQAVFAYWAGTAQWGNQEFYDKVRAIRALNDSLPPDRRIRFVGIDRTQDVALTGRLVTELVATMPAELQATPGLDSLQRLLAQGDDAPAATLAPLARRVAQRLPIHLSAPNLPTAPLPRLLQDLGYLEAPRVRRDSAMLLNLAAAYATHQIEPTDKLYGLWGVGHVAQGLINGSRVMAGLVKQSALPCADGVVSLVTFLLDSEMMIPAGAAPAWLRDPKVPYRLFPMSQDGPLVFAAGVRDLREATAPNTVTLFRLDAPDSPYRRSGRLTEARAPLFGQSMLPTQPNAATTDYFQYALLVRNSPAVKMRGK